MPTRKDRIIIDTNLWISLKAEFVVVTTFIDLSRSTKDNFLLSLANDKKANYLLTGDNDLLVLKKMGCANLMTISEFFVEKSVDSKNNLFFENILETFIRFQ